MRLELTNREIMTRAEVGCSANRAPGGPFLFQGFKDCLEGRKIPREGQAPQLTEGSRLSEEQSEGCCVITLTLKAHVWGCNGK